MQDTNLRRKTDPDALQAAVDSLHDAIIVASPSGSPAEASWPITYVNAAFIRIFGYSADEVVGRDAAHLACLMSGGQQQAWTVFDGDRRDAGESRTRICYARGGGKVVADWRIIRVDDAGGRPGSIVAIVRDITDNQRCEQALEDAEHRAEAHLVELESLYDVVPVGLAAFSPDLCYLRVNDSMAKLDGIATQDHVNRSLRDTLPDLAEQIEASVQRVFATGQPVLDVGLENKAEGLRRHGRSWRVQFYPRVVDGVVEAVGAVFEDVTEQRQSERQLKAVMQELNHRVKNSLAVVQSIASQTVRASRSLAEFEDALIGRIRALANTHTLLTESNWQSAELREIVRQSFRPYRAGENSIELKGCDVSLTPSASLALSMALHEMTTNAVKYGALAVPHGRVSVCWSLVPPDGDGDRELILRWSETGGVPATEPASVGFGSRLIDFTISHEFGGEVRREYREQGLLYEIAIPVLKIVAAPSA